MRALVTGAAGGIGSHLCEHLIAAGHDVVGIDNYAVGRFEAPYIQHISCLAVSDALFEERFDWVFHLAALADIVPSVKWPQLYFDNNVAGTMHMLEYARTTGVKRFIYAASSSCYGKAPVTPTNEFDRIAPAYPYALTKWLGEECVLHYAKVYGLPALSLRLFNVYGPRFRTSGTYGAVFGVFLSQLANGLPLTIVGDGEQRRDFTYVSDVCTAFLLAAESPYSGAAINIGSGSAHSVNELARIFGGNTTHIPKRPGEPDITLANIWKARNTLGYEPQVPFAEGAAWMLKHLDDYKNAPLWTEQSIATATQDWFKYLGATHD